MMTDHDNDVAAELRAVMGDYFDALLHDVHAPGDAIAVAPSEVVAVVVEEIPAPVAVDTVPSVAPEQTAPDAVPAIPSYQLIRIGGLTLAIPTHAIAGVVTAPAHWSPLADRRAWVLGAHSDNQIAVTVVDTAALLIPGGALQTDAGSAVLLAGQPWALACDGVGGRITPDPAQINWRGAQGKRPWLAGTLGVPSCALLDIPELLRLLEAES